MTKILIIIPSPPHPCKKKKISASCLYYTMALQFPTKWPIVMQLILADSMCQINICWINDWFPYFSHLLHYFSAPIWMLAYLFSFSLLKIKMQMVAKKTNSENPFCFLSFHFIIWHSTGYEHKHLLDPPTLWLNYL